MGRNKKQGIVGIIDGVFLCMFYIIAIPVCLFCTFVSVFGKTPKRRGGKFSGPGGH